jgi:hypothetical protein
MDTNGARHLAARIAQQQHWELAQAVQDGRQPASDPDGEQLEAIGDGCRLYATEVTNGANGRTSVQRFLKTLVNGSWEVAAVDESSEPVSATNRS